MGLLGARGITSSGIRDWAFLGDLKTTALMQRILKKERHNEIGWEMMSCISGMALPWLAGDLHYRITSQWDCFSGYSENSSQESL